MKTIPLLLLLFTLLPSASSLAQREYNIWCLGDRAGIDFNGAAPVAISCAINTLEGSTSIADRRTGRLLFYSDGATLYNRDHLPMAGSDGMKGDINSTQGSLIVPMPGDRQRYYLFTTDAGAYAGTPNEGAFYSVIDMTADGGRGAVVLRNVPLLASAGEKLTAIRHRDGCSYWVLVHGWESDGFYAYHLTDRGIEGEPVVSNVGSIHRDPIPEGRQAGMIGYMKASPNGRRLAVALYAEKRSELFDFDDATGVVSNPIVIPSEGQDYGVSFSPDNSKLYIGSLSMSLFQYDVTGGDSASIAATRTLLYKEADRTVNTHFGAMQIAPDGRIYQARLDSRWLGVIANPNAAGAACGYTPNGFELVPEGKARLGLPNLIDSYFAQGDLICGVPLARFAMSDTVCTGDSVVVTDQTEDEPEIWSWTFPGAEPASWNGATPPKVVYAAPGSYQATLTVRRGDRTSSVTRDVVVMARGELRASIDRGYTGNLGATFRVPVKLDEAMDGALLRDMIFTLNYRPGLLRLDSVVSDGALLDGWRFDSLGIDRTLGLYRVRLVAPAGAQLRGSGTLMTLCFKSYLDSVDSSELTFDLRATDNRCMYATARPGLIRVAICGYHTRRIMSTGPDFALDGNRPDPFGRSTRIDFTLGIDGPVTLTIHDATGRMVATLIDGAMEPGSYSILWNADGVPSGIYYYRLVAGSWSRTGSMRLVKE